MAFMETLAAAGRHTGAHPARQTLLPLPPISHREQLTHMCVVEYMGQRAASQPRMSRYTGEALARLWSRP